METHTQSKLYILVRSDIPVPDQAAQMCHAAEVHGIRYANESGPWGKSFGLTTTVLLSVDNEAQLNVWIRKIDQRGYGYKVVEIKEPDMGNQLTAIAYRTDSNIFSGLSLWTGERKGDPVY